MHRVPAPDSPKPLVTPPTLLRTWIRGYEEDDRALFEARYVFHLAGESSITGADDAQAALQPAPATVLPLPTAPP